MRRPSPKGRLLGKRGGPFVGLARPYPDFPADFKAGVLPSRYLMRGRLIMSAPDTHITVSPVEHRTVFDFLRSARRDRHLSPGAKLVLCALVDWVDWSGGRICDPSLAQLAEACGIGRSSALRHLRELKQRGVLNITPRGEKVTAIYRPVWLAYDPHGSLAAPARTRRAPARGDHGRFRASAPKRAVEPVQVHRGRASPPEGVGVISPEQAARNAAAADAILAATGFGKSVLVSRGGAVDLA